MALDVTGRLRLQINDPYIRSVEILYGDGTGSAFQVSGYPIASGAGSAKAFVSTTGGWSATGGSWDYGYGVFTTTGLPSANSALQMTYFHSVFSDAQLEDYLSRNGSNVELASLECIEALLMDASKRFRWGTNQGLMVDQTSIYRALKDQWGLLRDKLERGSIDSGGSVEWAKEQEHY